MFSYNVNTLKLTDKGYPDSLRHIAYPPKQLYYIGVNPSEWLARPKVAIVGSRKMTGYGRQNTTTLAAELSRYGVVIISGLALGVDATAHQAAIENGTITAAVLPTSLEQIYPAVHTNLALNIIKSGGTILTEYAKGTINFRGNFVARNRIVSGLADILLITEASIKSGTLHTARFALEQGKTVMAIPGNINNLKSEGCNSLIKSGAIPVTNVEDILFALKISPNSSKKKVIFRGQMSEELILKYISDGISSQEELALAAKLTGQEVVSALTTLEIAGAIRPLSNGYWTLA